MEYIVKFNGAAEAIGFPAELLSENYAIVDISPEQAQALLYEPNVEYMEPAEYVMPFQRNTIPTVGSTPTRYGVGNTTLDGTGVVISIIDSGIDLNHPEFQNAKILSVWDMTAEGTPPEGFLKGREYSRAEIEAGLVDSTDTLGHGTAVAAIAAGISGVAPGASLIIIKLGSGSALTTDIMRGIRYSIRQARALNMPCVINLSYGTNVGSHRGQSLFEGYVNEMSSVWKTLIVAATGNEGAGGHHFRAQLQTGQSVRAEFSVSFAYPSLYLLLWNNFVDDFTYEIRLPSGRTTGRILFSGAATQVAVEQTSMQIIRRDPTHYKIDRELLFLLQAANGLPVGNWSLICYGEKIVVGKIDIWLPTVEEVGRETAFYEPSPAQTATLPSTAQRVLSVGGYRPDINAISPFSGRGEIEVWGEVLPDIVAPAENVRSASPGGGYALFDGTSMAAPFAAGAAALMMQWGIVLENDPFLYGQRIRAFLRRYADRDSYLSYPNPLWGYGKLNIQRTLTNLAFYTQQGGVIL